MNLDTNIHLLLSIVFIIGGLYLLAKSADRFVEESSRIARAFKVSPLIIGMVIIGFGTSAPELAVSALSSLAGKSDLSLGNAYGSCIFNIAGILGIAALIKPIKVSVNATCIGVPLLLGVCALAYLLSYDLHFSRIDGIILLASFLVVVPLYCLYDQKNAPQEKDRKDLPDTGEAIGSCKIGNWIALILSLATLILSSHVLVWGCVDFARDVLKVSPLVIGLTIVAVGTSLPELASAFAAARRGEHEFIIGNIIGSNLFNTLAVVGLAGTISPFKDFSHYILTRDIPVMIAISIFIFIFGFNFRAAKKSGVINRVEGGFFLVLYCIYLATMVIQELSAPACR